MKMYRAVARVEYDAGKKYVHQRTKRMPSIVPYLVDNVWEWLRPEGAPSRRHAVYASPTPALALRNAAGAGPDRANYVACELTLVPGLQKVAHLKVKDAREHDDIPRLIKGMPALLADNFADLALQDKARFAALYLPASSRDDLATLLGTPEQPTYLGEKVRGLSTFWSDARLSVDAESDGELFFEIPEGGHYLLRSV